MCQWQPYRVECPVCNDIIKDYMIKRLCGNWNRRRHRKTTLRPRNLIGAKVCTPCVNDARRRRGEERAQRRRERQERLWGGGDDGDGNGQAGVNGGADAGGDGEGEQ